MKATELGLKPSSITRVRPLSRWWHDVRLRHSIRSDKIRQLIFAVSRGHSRRGDRFHRLAVGALRLHPVSGMVQELYISEAVEADASTATFRQFMDAAHQTFGGCDILVRVNDMETRQVISDAGCSSSVMTTDRRIGAVPMAMPAAIADALDAWDDTLACIASGALILSDAARPAPPPPAPRTVTSRGVTRWSPPPDIPRQRLDGNRMP